MQVTDALEEGALKIVQSRPSLLVLNKRDVIKPGEVAKKLQVMGYLNHAPLLVFGFLSLVMITLTKNTSACNSA